MEINSDTIRALRTVYSKRFQDGFALANNDWQKYCQVEQSTGAVSVYPFLLSFGGMEEWKGDRQLKNVETKTFELPNRKFEDSVSVPRDTIEDDQYGTYGTVIQQMGMNANSLWGDIADELLTERAAAATWADDAAFFATNRKYKKNTIVNKGTVELSATAYAATRGTMRSYKAHNDKPLKVNPNLLIIGQSNEEVAFDILKNELVIAAGANKKNVWYGTADILILPCLTGVYAKWWFLADVSNVIKPVIVQQRRLPKFTALDRDTDQNVFDRDEYVYGTDARGATAYTMPHLIYGNFPEA